MTSLTLNCTNCGANLEVSQDMERFACGYCGSQQIVERRGGTVALKPLTDAIRLVQSGTDKTAAELALKRMKQELVALQDSYRARIGQASIAKNNTITLALVGTVVVSVVIVGAISKQTGAIGSLIVFTVAVVLCFAIIKNICKPINEALERDLAEIGTQARTLENRIAEKKILADS